MLQCEQPLLLFFPPRLGALHSSKKWVAVFLVLVLEGIFRDAEKGGGGKQENIPPPQKKKLQSVRQLEQMD